jgi:DNA invertase Pin-like site-specific DNA recombinase
MEQYNSKIKSIHLKRKAVLYIRQSTMRQVYENNESTLRQYALKEKLLSFGWPSESIQIIDCDLGHSGASISGREGFRQMIADVGSGLVGAVACIECSRLSRSSNDWGRLMEICALTGAILIDVDGIYDPNNFNDRLLLGLKGTMSEAELHFLKERMRGGALNKAKRGELRCPLPIGYQYDESGSVVKVSNIDIQNAVMLFFKTFRVCGTANRMVSYYREHGYKIPINPRRGFGCNEIVWESLTASKAVKLLRNPAYAGIYAYGQHQGIYTIEGKMRKRVAEEEWISHIENHHEGYISTKEYKENGEILTSNNSHNQKITAPREGNALLQGIAICGKCGNKMYVVYKHTDEASTPYYSCYGCNPSGHFSEGPPCQIVHGKNPEESVVCLILEKLTPAAVESAIKVQTELEKRRSSEDNFFILKVERAQYELELAKKRYMNVDPENRLVAFELEKIWNHKITALALAEKELKEYKNKVQDKISSNDIQKLLSVPETTRELWQNPRTGIQDKKRILRCIIENVTINKVGQSVQLGILFKSGASTSIECKNPPKKYEEWVTPPEVLNIIRTESKRCNVEEITEILKNSGFSTGKGAEFNVSRVRGIQYRYNIPTFKQYLYSQGYLPTEEKSKILGISINALNKRRIAGKYEGECLKTTGNGDYMFSP